MKFVERLKNIWALGEAVQQAEDEFYDHTERLSTTEITAPPKPQNVFIPRITRDPVKEIVNEQQNDD